MLNRAQSLRTNSEVNIKNNQNNRQVEHVQKIQASTCYSQQNSQNNGKIYGGCINNSK